MTSQKASKLIHVVTPCWLLLITFFSFTCLKMASRIISSNTLPETDVCSFLAPLPCPFWKQEWQWISSSSQAYLPFSMAFQRWQTVFNKHFYISLSTCGCIPLGLMDLCTLGLHRWSLTRYFLTMGKSYFPQTLSLISRVWDSWMPFCVKSTIMKAKEKR